MSFLRSLVNLKRALRERKVWKEHSKLVDRILKNKSTNLAEDLAKFDECSKKLSEFNKRTGDEMASLREQMRTGRYDPEPTFLQNVKDLFS